MQSTFISCPSHGTRDASGDYSCRACGATWDYADGSEHPQMPSISVPVVRHKPQNLRFLAQQLLTLADRIAAAEMAGRQVGVTGSVTLQEIDQNVYTLIADLAVRLPK